jgi:hypothetical protein
MFGPLNGVRLALVILAGVAAIVAAGFGQWTVTAVLSAGILIHGMLWLKMYRDHNSRPPEI